LTQKTCIIIVLVILVATFFTSCDKAIEKKYLSKDMNPNSIKDLTKPIEEEETEISEIIYNDEQKIIIPEAMKQNVSLSLNEKVPIRSVLYELSRKLNINFQMDPTIKKSIIFSARNKSFVEIIDSICDVADLRYSIHNNMISIVNDCPYTVTYNLRFLNFSRDSENKISIATEVSSGASQENSRNIPNDNSNTIHSDSNVIVKTKNDFWAEFEDGIKVILGKDEKYSINKQAGVINVSGNSKQHKSVIEYINAIKESTESQVLIEAKIIEVSLKNEYKRGIDWNLLSRRIDIQSESGTSILNNTVTPFTGKYKSKGMNILLNAIEEFGVMRTISNPRITAMNNQAAILKVA
jgi:general secretion pathway protein D